MPDRMAQIAAARLDPWAARRRLDGPRRGRRPQRLRARRQPATSAATCGRCSTRAPAQTAVRDPARAGDRPCAGVDVPAAIAAASGRATCAWATLVVDCRAARALDARARPARARSAPAPHRWRRRAAPARGPVRRRPMAPVACARGRSRRRLAGAAAPRSSGRGPGLTPAGDDVLVGILAVLHRWPAGRRRPLAASCGSRGVAGARCCRGRPTSAPHSCDSGRARSASASALHDLVGADRSAAPDDVDAAHLDALLDTGATSGADALRRAWSPPAVRLVLPRPAKDVRMSTSSRIYPNLYKDSVSLMTVSAQVWPSPGSRRRRWSWRPPTNVENLAAGRPRRIRGQAQRPRRRRVRHRRRPAPRRWRKADELLSREPPRRRRRRRRPSSRRPASRWRSPRDPAHQLRPGLGARRLRRRRGDEGAAARHGRDDVQRQRAAGAASCALKQLRATRTT